MLFMRVLSLTLWEQDTAAIAGFGKHVRMPALLSNNIQQQTEHAVSKYDKTLQAAANGIKDSVIPVPTSYGPEKLYFRAFSLQLSLGLKLLHCHGEKQPTHN